MKKKLTLKIIFDTSVVYTGSANDLLRKEIIDIINNHSSLSDIEINWFVPEIVVKERTFQMNKKGIELLLSIQKLERLLGHNLNINEEIIALRIDETIAKQVKEFSIQVVKIDTTKVNWETIIHSALFRHPPFEDGEKEKGFRDALVLETLKQITEESPSTKSICRIVFITNDKLLFEAASNATASLSNVNIFNNTEELKSLINVLTSEITEELINAIAPQAEKLFFQKEDKTTLYYIEDIRSKIANEYSKEINLKPEGVDERTNGTWWINKPGFEKKVKQRVFWKSIIEVDFENFKTSFEQTYEPIKDLSLALSALSSGILRGLSTSSIREPLTERRGLASLASQIKKDKVGSGKTRFEVTWSVTLTTKRKLTNPKIESIKYLETANK